MANNLTKKEEKPLSVTDETLGRIKELEKSRQLIIPPNYSAENALKSAYLILQETKAKGETSKSVLETCSRASIGIALLDMVIQGLSPAKKQCYFVPFGRKLTLMKSYMGTMAAAKLIPGVKDIKAHCIYEGDEFKTSYNFKTGAIEITSFNPSYENVDFNKMKGAFCVIVGEDGILHTEIMNMKQIEQAWNQGQMKGNSPAHKNFKDQMAKKTVINRACKLYVNTTNDSGLFAESFNKTEDLTSEDVIEINDNQVIEDIEENANKTTIDMDAVVDTEFAEVVEDEPNEVVETEPIEVVEDGPVMEVKEGEIPF